MLAFPNAKINLGLFVTDKREDGYHNLESIFIPIELSDILEIVEQKSSKAKTKCHIQLSGIIPEGDVSENLCCKAYNLLDIHYSLPPVSIYLHKQIPTGAGLGGGSSDAVAALQVLDKLFNLNLAETTLFEYASQLGSDCMFFTINKPALVKGRGEIIKPLETQNKRYWCVLIKPEIAVPTKLAYQKVQFTKPTADLSVFLSLPENDWRNFFQNSFETSVFKEFPVICEIKNFLYEQGAFYAQMSGSGSAVFGLFEKEKNIQINNPQWFIWQGYIVL